MSGKQTLREWVPVIVVAVILGLFLRTFVVERFVVDGPSMEPTLRNREEVLVNKFVYRFTAPKRNDVVVFRYPLNPNLDYIKRVVAVGGQTVEVRNGKLFVDGVAVEEPMVRPWTGNLNKVIVPQGYVFVMGDNRPVSEDSRVFGPIPESSIRGKAFLVWWPLSRMRLIK
ncbi:MAG: signal peptidase I [Bacillota bacterium]